MPKPPDSAQEQLLSAVQNAKNRLEYLTRNDWALILDRAQRVAFKKNDKLVEQRKLTKTLYLVASGNVNVMVALTPIARIGPGEICGEMAFLEASVPSATATAEGTVEAYALGWDALEDLFQLYPHLASRFYRSLAVSLSRRLREQIAKGSDHPE
jgi:CRP-like cAMP-binding protein